MRTMLGPEHFGHKLVRTMLVPEHFRHIREDVLEKTRQCETRHCPVSARNPRRASRTRNWRLHHMRRRGVVYHDTPELGQLKDAFGKKSKRTFPAPDSLATLRGPDVCVTATVPGPPPKEPEGGMEDAEARDAGDGERERTILQRRRARMSRTREQKARRSRVVAAPGESTTQVVNVGGRLSRMDANEIEDHLCRGEKELDIMNIEVRGPGPRPGAARKELRRRSAVLMAGARTVDEEGRLSTNWEPLEAVAEFTPCASIEYILSDYNAETVGRTHPGEQDAYSWAGKNASQEARVMRKAADDGEELGKEYYALGPNAMGSLRRDETTLLNEKIAAVRQQTKHAFGQEIPVGRRRVLLIDELVAADPNMKAACQGQSWAKAMEREILKLIEHHALRRFEQGEKALSDYRRVELFWGYDIKSTGVWKARLAPPRNPGISDGVDRSLEGSSSTPEGVFWTLEPEGPTGWAGTRVVGVKSIYGLSTAAYFSAKTYIAELQRWLEGGAEHGSSVNYGTRKIPMEASARPEEDVSKLLGVAGKSSFAADFSALRTATEVAVGLRNERRSFRVAIQGPCVIFGDNLGATQNTALRAFPQKKRHTSISFHKARARFASGMVWVAKPPSECRVADIFTKPPGVGTLHGFVERFLSRGGRLPPKLGDWTPKVETTARGDEVQSGECAW